MPMPTIRSARQPCWRQCTAPPLRAAPSQAGHMGDVPSATLAILVVAVLCGPSWRERRSRCCRWPRPLGPDNTTILGRRAEDLACRHLEALGFQLLERNYRCRAGEIDIVMLDGNPLHPDVSEQWRLAADVGATVVGVSPAYLAACRKSDVAARLTS